MSEKDQQPPARLITTRPDAEIAEDLRRRLLIALRPVQELINEARSHKLVVVQFGGTVDNFGNFEYRAQDILINKPL